MSLRGAKRRGNLNKNLCTGFEMRLPRRGFAPPRNDILMGNILRVGDGLPVPEPAVFGFAETDASHHIVPPGRETRPLHDESPTPLVGATLAVALNLSFTGFASSCGIFFDSATEFHIRYRYAGGDRKGSPLRGA